MLFSLLSGSFDLFTVLAQILACVLIVLVILPLHEWAHGFIAYKLGDNTAKNMGRLRFNPAAHVDPIGALCLLLFNFGWAKPVPVNPSNFKNPKKGMALVALAGPGANIIAGAVGAFLINLFVFFFSAQLVTATGIPFYIYIFLENYTYLNIFLAVFNLIPLPPLDGSKILGAFLPDRIMYNMYKYERITYFILIALLFSGILRGPMGKLCDIIRSGLLWLTGLPFG